MGVSLEIGLEGVSLEIGLEGVPHSWGDVWLYSLVGLLREGNLCIYMTRLTRLCQEEAVRRASSGLSRTQRAPMCELGKRGSRNCTPFSVLPLSSIAMLHSANLKCGNRKKQLYVW